jgi:ABC-2 type transport system ATP-binding protein
MPIYPELTGAGYLSFLAGITNSGPAPHLERLLRRFNVSDLDLARRMRDYSHGMKRKLGLIQALMGEPRVLILDEPTSGLDPLMIDAFAETIDELARSGRTTILLSSHVLSEVDRVCSRIGLVRAGRLVSVQTLSELRAATPRRLTVTFSQAVDADVPSLPGWTLVTRDRQLWVIDVRGPIGAFITTLNGLPVSDISLTPFALEDAILRFFGDAPS